MLLTNAGRSADKCACGRKTNQKTSLLKLEETFQGAVLGKMKHPLAHDHSRSVWNFGLDGIKKRRREPRLLFTPDPGHRKENFFGKRRFFREYRNDEFRP